MMAHKYPSMTWQGRLGTMGAKERNPQVKHPPSRYALERACSMKEELLAKIEVLGEVLPPNTLDQLIDELGGPEKVAEMTGRKGRIVQRKKGAVQYESRSEGDISLEMLNMAEKQRYLSHFNYSTQILPERF